MAISCISPVRIQILQQLNVCGTQGKLLQELRRLVCFAAWMRNRSKAMAQQRTPGHQIGRELAEQRAD